MSSPSIDNFDSSIPPVSGETGSEESALPATSGPTDTLESSSSTSTQRLSIIDYFARVELPSLEHYKVQIENEQALILDSRSFYIAIAEELESYRKVINDVIGLEEELEDLLDAAEALNEAIANLVGENGSKIDEDNAQIAALNEAINEYLDAVDEYNNVINDPESTPEEIAQAEEDLIEAAENYNAARNEYEAYVSERKADFDAYNEAAAIYNAIVEATDFDDLNEKRQNISDDLPLLDFDTVPILDPLPDPPPALEEPFVPPPTDLPDPIDYTSVPVETIDITSLLIGGNLFPPFTGDASSSDVYNLLLNIRALFSANANRIGLSSVLTELFRLREDTFVLPPAFIDGLPLAFFEAERKEAPSSGVSIQNFMMALTLNTPVVVQMLNEALGEASSREETSRLPSEVGDAVVTLIGEANEFNFTNAILPIISTLDGITVVEPNFDAFVRILLGLNGGQSLLEQILEGDFEEPVSIIVRDQLIDQGISDAALNDVTAIVTAATNINLLNNVLLITAQTLGLPSLPGDILQQVDTLPAQNLVVATAPDNISIDDVVTDPANLLVLKSALLDRAREDGVDDGAAIPVINNAVNDLFNNVPISSDADLRRQTFTSLQNQGVSPTVALNLADTASTVVNNERQTPLPTRRIDAADIDQGAVIDAVATTLPETERPDQVDTALTTTLRTDFGTVRGFREQFILDLTDTGVAPTDARDIANVATARINPTPPFALENVQQEPLQTSLVLALTQSPISAPATLEAPEARRAATRPVQRAPEALTSPVFTEPVAIPIAQNAIETAFNTNPQTPDTLRSELQVALTTQGVDPALARAAADTAFITTRDTAIPNLDVSKENVRNDINTRLEQVTGARQEQIADDFIALFYDAPHSLRNQLNDNYKVFEKHKDAIAPRPTVTDPIHKQTLDSFFKEAIVINSTNAADEIIGTFRAHPSFGMPQDKIDFPNELRG